MTTQRDIYEQNEFHEWVDNNADDLLTEYIESEPEAPDSIYTGVVDDDYADAYEAWLEKLSLEDIPEDWLVEKYEVWLNEHYERD